MQKTLFIALLSFVSLSLTAQSGTFHQFKAESIDGKTIDMASFKGKKLMVVNVASKCGLTPQYSKLQELYEQYAPHGFEIVAFPANNFLSQEPGSNAEIKQFCAANYGVSFTMMAKISVKGNDISPIYQWLTQKSLNGVTDSEVKWNFQKYLINEQGELVKVISPRTAPDDPEIINWLKNQR